MKRMLSHSEIRIRNLCNNLLELCSNEMKFTNENDILKDFKQEIFKKEEEVE